MKMVQNLRRRAKQAGLTLIELLVVLVILTGIGGLLIPTINSALSRTHVATCAQTFPEVHQMIQRAQLENPGSFGTDFDSGITTGTSTPVNSVTGGTLAAVDLTDGEALALAAVGITSVVDHAVAPPNITFDIGATQRLLVNNVTTPTAASTTPAVITLTDDQAESIFLEAGGSEKYVWFGIGRDWTLLGDVAPEPPAHFGDTPGALPDQVHSRFGVIFQVADAAGAALSAAEYKRVSYCLDGDGFETADGHVEVYWEELNNTQ
ncbi:MAG: type II secretion system protein [Verrucomicrobiota bacterium]